MNVLINNYIFDKQWFIKQANYINGADNRQVFI